MHTQKKKKKKEEEKGEKKPPTCCLERLLEVDKCYQQGLVFSFSERRRQGGSPPSKQKDTVLILVLNLCHKVRAAAAAGVAVLTAGRNKSVYNY